MRNPLPSRSRDEEQEILGQLALRAEMARTDIFAFYDFVMRKVDKDEPVRIKDAPHHALMLDFLMDHEEGTIIAPVGVGKSSVALCYTLFRIGRDPSTCGAIVSATQQIAQRTTNLVRAYVDAPHSRLSLVFPNLRRGDRPGDKWTDNELTVKRPSPLAAPTLSAFGIGTDAVLGSRLDWVLGDDVTSPDNTATPAERRKVRELWQQKFKSRKSPANAAKWKCFLVNTPWHPEDLVEMSVKPPKEDGTGGDGWPGLRMDAYGDVHIHDEADVLSGEKEPWDSERVRPKLPGTSEQAVRLVANDPDPENEKPLWLQRWPTAADVDKLRRDKTPTVFNQTIRCIVRDDATAMCPSTYVHRCYQVARSLGVKGFAVDRASARGGPFLHVFTGVDPAFTESDKSDYSSIFTFGVREDGIKVILHLEFGKWSPPTLGKKVVEVAVKFDSIIAMESNAGGGPIISFMKDSGVSIPLKGLRTGKEKWSPEYGVATFFSEMEAGDWAFPFGRPASVEKLAEDCVNYVPTRHTSDLLMSCFVGRKQAKAWGVLNGRGPKARQRQATNAERHSKLRRELDLARARGGGGSLGWGGTGGVASSVMDR